MRQFNRERDTMNLKTILRRAALGLVTAVSATLAMVAMAASQGRP